MKKNGFTLIELLITISITALIASFSLPFYSAWQNSSAINNYKAQVIENLELAKLRAEAGLHNTSHGIYFNVLEDDADSFVLFQGENYVSRNIQYDREIKISESISLSTTLLENEIVFLKYTGLPQTTGIVNLTENIISENHEILINQLGMVLYN
jgi:prepilin-type N-terminal cleavage/methylation domain-containing protein